MYFPWIMTMSSGHKMRKIMIFAQKKKIVWSDDPPEDRMISIFAGCLPNHDRAHSQSSFREGVPASGFRQNRYLGPSWGAGGNSAHRHDWSKVAALSGQFGVYPDEPMYSEVHPEGPGRPDKHQDHKRIPL
jgi:hypothetical protein